MDTFSHAAWGYVALRWKGPKMAWAGALAGAAPDLLFFIPSRIDQIMTSGWAKTWSFEHNPAVWRADGPPLPPELEYVYHHYYVYTHSLVILAAILLLMYFAVSRKWLWLGVPYALHLLMDFPTHERFQTPLFYPISSWTFQGLQWSSPVIFIPNVILLVAAFLFIWWKYHHKMINEPVPKTLQ